MPRKNPGIISRIGTALRSSVAPVFQAFDAGKMGRRLTAIPSNTVAINNLIRTYGRSAVARSRYLTVNNPYASQAREVFKSAMAGYGIKPSALNLDEEDKKEVQSLWDDWIETADYDGIADFYGLQDQVAGELFDAGEAFLEIVDNEVGPGTDVPPFSLRLIPSEMVPFDNNTPQLAGGGYISMSIEFDASGKRVAYHVLPQNPGDAPLAATYQPVRIPAERIIHVFRPIRAGQIRGVPYTLASLTTLAMMDLYDDAELERKRMSALFAAFVTRPDSDDSAADHPLGAIETDPISGDQSFNMTPGSVVELNPGEEVTFSTPPNTDTGYEAFQYRMLLRAAAGFGIPYASMTGDLRRANYGSIRAGLIEFKRRIESMQWHTMIFQLCRPVWRKFIEMGTLHGLMPWSVTEYTASPRTYRKVKWIPPKWDWVDPQKDIMAEKIAVDNGFKARSDVIEAFGEDPVDTDRRIEEDHKREADLGLTFSRDIIEESQLVSDAAPDPQEAEVHND